jgi:hypothetical protein
MYSGLSAVPAFVKSQVLIPGVFTDPGLIKKGVWQLVDHKRVDPTKIEFPEVIISFENHFLFQRGEISLPLLLRVEDSARIKAYHRVCSPELLPDICLYYLDLLHLIKHDYADSMNLKDSDLRFSEYRHEVYELLGEDENESYFDMSIRLGHDIRRFF